MSDYLSIAAVTATIAREVGEALEQIPNPSQIPRVRFANPERDPDFVGCSIVLYRLQTNPFQRNAALPARDGNGIALEKPRVTLDAHYLFAFSGEDATLEPQRFLGAVVSAFNAQPFLSSDSIRRTVNDTPYLNGLDLSDQLQPVRLVQRDVDGATLSQVWALFPGIPYQLSVFYTASPITIESQITPVEIPPVTQVNVSVDVA